MGLDVTLHQPDPRARIHRHVHLTQPAEDQRTLPGLFQRARPRDRGALLNHTGCKSRRVRQVILQHRVAIDEELVRGTGSAEGGSL